MDYDYRHIPGLHWEFNDTDYSPAINEIESLSDRAGALVAAAFLEIRLTEKLKQNLPVKDGDVLDAVFRDGSGSLGSFEQKNKMAHLMGLFTYEGYKDLREISRIRNEFAHELEARTFDDSPVREFCMNIKLVARFVLQPPPGVSPYEPIENATTIILANARNRFFHAISSYSSAMKVGIPPYF